MFFGVIYLEVGKERHDSIGLGFGFGISLASLPLRPKQVFMELIINKSDHACKNGHLTGHVHSFYRLFSSSFFGNCR